MEKQFEPKGLPFFDKASNREMILIQAGQPYAGWLCYRHADGQWVTLRKATEQDIEHLDASFVSFASERSTGQEFDT